MTHSDAEQLAHLVGLGRLLTERRSLMDALRVLEDAVRYAEKVHGPESLETRDVLALLERAIGLARVDDTAIFPIAERMYRISLGAFGSSDRRMHHPMEHYARSLEMAGRREEALGYYARAADLAEPMEKGDVVLLYSYARALAEARRTEEALGVVDRMRALEALDGPAYPEFSPMAIWAIAHFADATKASIVLKYIDEEASGATSVDMQIKEARAMLLEAMGESAEPATLAVCPEKP